MVISNTDMSLLIGIITIILSVSVSAFVSGTRWGRIESDIKSMNDRLAKIEGMFTLQFRGPVDHG